MNTNLKKYLQSEINENKLSHAFLVSTNNPILTQRDIYSILKDNNMVSSQPIENNIAIYNICAEKNLIDKNKILDLQKFAMTKSTLSEYKVYFIMNAELMNSYASNKLLKILEEPSDNIIGFLITTDESSIIPTIKSRCLHISNYYEEDNSNKYEEIIDALIRVKELKYIEILELKKEICTYEKQEIINILNSYKKYISQNMHSINNVKELANLYKILDNIISLITSNVNIELSLDKMFIEMRK